VASSTSSTACGAVGSHDAHHLFQFAHELSAVLQTAGGIDQHHLDAVRLGRGDGIESETGRVGARRTRLDVGAGARAPDRQLIDSGGAEGVAGHQHHVSALGAEFGGELADGGGLAGAVDAADQNDERPRGDFKRLGDGAQDLLDLAGQHGLYFVGRDAFLEAAVAQHFDHACGEIRAQVGADQFVFELLHRRGIELALRHQIGDGAAERGRRALEPAAQAFPPASALCAVTHVAHVIAVSALIGKGI